MTGEKEQQREGAWKKEWKRESKKEETGKFVGGFLVWVRNLPVCQPRLDIKWWQCDRNYLLTLLLKLCGLRFGDGKRGKELDEHVGKIGMG